LDTVEVFSNDSVVKTMHGDGSALILEQCVRPHRFVNFLATANNASQQRPPRLTADNVIEASDRLE